MADAHPVTETARLSEAMRAKFTVGQIIRHKLYGYRGLICDVDAVYSHDPDWYAAMAQSRPPKDQPWYHVLVDGEDYVTYVAERNLEETQDVADPIDHPLLTHFFSRRGGGSYSVRAPIN